LIHCHSDIFSPAFRNKGKFRKKIHLLSMILY
jgi:hypothetical protein